MNPVRPTIQNQALIAFGALVLLAMANFALAEVVLSRISRVSDTVVWTSELYKLTRRIAHASGHFGPGRGGDPRLAEQSLAALDREISQWPAAPDVSHIPVESELRVLWDSVTSDWSRLRDAYKVMRQLPADGPAGDKAIRPLADAGADLEASIGAVNYLSVRELDTLYQQVRFLSYVIAPLDLGLLLMIFAGLRRQVVRPLARLSEAARNYTGDGYAGEFQINSRNEIGDLSHVLHRAATRVQALIGQVRHDTDTIRQAESKFRSLVDNCGVGVFLVQDDRFRYVNQQFADILGRSPEDLVDQVSVVAQIYPDDRPTIEDAVRRSLDAGTGTTHFECRLWSASGAVLPCEVFQSRTEYDGRPAFIGTLIDLSERKRTDEQLRKLSRAIEQSPATVVVTDRNGLIEYINPRCAELTGYTSEEAIGQTPRMFQSGLTPKEVYSDLWRAVLSGREWSGEMLNRKKNGELFWEHMIASPVKDANGNITHLVAVKEDITARKRVEQELQRANRTLQVLSECSQAMVHAQTEEELLKAICRHIVELGGYRLAFVGLPSDAEASAVHVAARHGVDAGYIDRWLDADRGKGPCGASIRRREPIVVRDVGREPAYQPWAEEAAMRGLGASIALPLLGEPDVLGTLRIFSADKDSFADDEVKLLGELADDLAYGIRSLRAREERKRAVAALEESEERFRTISASAQDAIVMIDDRGMISYWNQAAERMFGYSQTDILGRPVLHRLLAPEHLSTIDRMLTQLRTSGQSATLNKTGELTALRRSGASFPAEVSAAAVRIAGRWQIVAMARDISARRQSEEALNIRTRAIESSSNAIIIAKATRAEDNPIIYVNPAFERITGYPKSEVIGRNPRLLIGDDWGQPEIDKLRDCLRRSMPAQVTLRNYRKDGTPFWNELSIAPVKDDSGTLTHYISVINDVTERMRYEEELQHRATHDELTGLANRVLLFDRIEQAIAHSTRSDRHVAVMLLDLDRFKVINDSLGHGVGDSVVKTVGDRLKTCVRRGDTVARVGGDEFAIVLAELQNTTDASHVAWKIQEAVSYPIEVPGQQLFVTTSIGISVAPIDGSQAEALLKNADVAMYAAKEQGGSCFRFYAPGMNDRAVERLSLEGDLRRAVDRNEFVLHYQPKVDVGTGKVVGAEALIRWKHPKHGLVPPMEFIPLAEETGLIASIGEWALRCACERARFWQDIGLPPITIAVNLSARQFRQPNLARIVRRVLAQSRLDPRHLDLELTESMVMQNAQATITALQELKDTGVSISIDDFGTGYSSLSYLKRFPVDTLKIDRSFIRDMDSSDDGRTITSSIVLLAHGLGMRVVAEGVETASQLDLLREYGCDEIQGYLFSKPLPEDEFVAFVRGTNGCDAPEAPPGLTVVRARAAGGS